MWVSVKCRRLIYLLLKTDSLRGALEQEAASSKPTILLMMDTEMELVVVSPEVELVVHVVQIRVGQEKCTINNNARGFVGKEREDKAHTVGEEVLIDDQIGSCAGIKVMGISTAECPVVFVCPQSKKLSLSLGPLLAAPD